MAEMLALAQGFYFLVTGVWPLVSIGTFQKVTGPKTDLWLVKTLGVLIAVVGAALLLAGAAGEVNRPVVLLAIGSALGLVAVDVVFVARRVISRVYLLDAAAEALLIAAWLVALAVD